MTWRDVTFCHGLETTRYNPTLPGTIRYYRPGNFRAITGISSDLQHSIAMTIYSLSCTTNAIHIVMSTL
eukprot:771850-Amorphochlora_amoeboformis.AAC.1